MYNSWTNRTNIFFAHNMDTFVASLVSNGSSLVIPDPGELLAPIANSDHNITTSTPPEEVNGAIKVLEKVIIPILWGLIIIGGLLGNGLVVYVMLRYGERQTTNCYIVNLAFTDLAFVLICVPFTMLHYIYPRWIYGRFMCKFTLYMTYVSTRVSIHSYKCSYCQPVRAYWHLSSVRVSMTVCHRKVQLCHCSFVAILLVHGKL